jgi:hypothetical protein
MSFFSWELLMHFPMARLKKSIFYRLCYLVKILLSTFTKLFYISSPILFRKILMHTLKKNTSSFVGTSIWQTSFFKGFGKHITDFFYGDLKTY